MKDNSCNTTMQRDKIVAQLSHNTPNATWNTSKLRIHEVQEALGGVNRARVGSFKRKAKGREYTSPRIILRRHFKKHIGKECLVLEGKASLGDIQAYQNMDMLLVLFPKLSKLQSAS